MGKETQMSSYNRIAAQLIALLTVATSILGALRATEDKNFTVHFSIERAQNHNSPTTIGTTILRKSSN
jgi:hypothetical protein